MPMLEYKLVLALENLMAALLASLGVWVLARMLRQLNPVVGRIAYLGWGLITLGLLVRSLWEVTTAASAGRINLMALDSSRVVWLAAGFSLLAWAVWCGQRVIQRISLPSNPWLMPGFGIGLGYLIALTTYLAGQSQTTWFVLLLTLATAGNLLLSALLIRQAYWQDQPGVAGLFLLNLLSVFVLSNTARLPGASPTVGGWQSAVDILGQAALALAAFRLRRRLGEDFERIRFGVAGLSS